MIKYEFKAINLIAETFEQNGVEFDVKNHDGMEELRAFIPLHIGNYTAMRFISHDNDNDVAVRIIGLVSNTPKEKRTRVMEACNALNHRFRYMSFTLDDDGDVIGAYDFPVCTPDESIGEMALEIFGKAMHILNSGYSIFMKALYTENELSIQENNVPAELMQRLHELRKMMEARMTDAEDSSDDDSVDLEPDLETVGSPDDAT
jgi:hypothetical protein